MLAFDLGASSGRAVIGHLVDQHLSIQDVHRFPNQPVRVHSHLYWDILRLFHEVKQGIRATRLEGYSDIQSIGIDTWAVDFGLIGTNGELLGNPYHYRDTHTLGIMEEVWQLVPQKDLFARTGIQSLSLNTLYQLYALKKANSPLLAQAENLLMIPDLLRYFLTGERHSEWTNTSTTQLCNPNTQTWDSELLQQVGLPTRLFTTPVSPGTFAGSLLPSVSEETGIPSLPVIAVAEHDTASAVAAIPTEEESFAYLSCGTWSLIGTEIAQPILTEQALAWNVTNEGGVDGTFRLLKNVTGLWLLQECQRAWRNEGKLFSRYQEASLLDQARPFQAFIDPDAPAFVHPLHMPRQIQQYCRETGQSVPETEGDIMRCIVESLACKYRFVLERIEQLTNKRFSGLHMVGGGIQNTFLCQYTANVLGRPVWAGPQEATAIGNMLVQYMALEQIQTLQHGRRIVRESFPYTTYEPKETETWDRAFQLFCERTQIR